MDLPRAGAAALLLATLLLPVLAALPPLAVFVLWGLAATGLVLAARDPARRLGARRALSVLVLLVLAGLVGGGVSFGLLDRPLGGIPPSAWGAAFVSVAIVAPPVAGAILLAHEPRGVPLRLGRAAVALAVVALALLGVDQSDDFALGGDLGRMPAFLALGALVALAAGLGLLAARPIPARSA